MTPRCLRALARGALILGTAIGTLSLGTLVSAQINMPNPKDISGVPLPAADLPAGAVSVRVVRGGFDKNIADQPVEFTIGATKKVVKTDAGGRAQVDGLSPGTVVVASTTVAGEVLTSQSITVGASGVRVVLVATDPDAAARAAEDAKLAAGPAVKGTVVFGPNTRIVIEPGDEVLTIFYVLDIVNSARSPVDIGGPLMIELPKGARAAGVMDGSSPQAKINGPRLTVLGPFAPGSTEVQIGFELPTGGDSKTFVQRWPVAVPDTTIVLQRTGNEDMASPGIADKRETTSNGQRVVFARGTAVGPGGMIALDVTGLAHHARWPRYLALTFGLGLVAVGLREGFRRA